MPEIYQRSKYHGSDIIVKGCVERARSTQPLLATSHLMQKSFILPLTFVDPIVLPLLLLLLGLEHRPDHGDRVQVPVDGVPARRRPGGGGGLHRRLRPLRSPRAVVRGSRRGGRRRRRDGRPEAARPLGKGLQGESQKVGY